MRDEWLACADIVYNLQTHTNLPLQYEDQITCNTIAVCFSPSMY